MCKGFGAGCCVRFHEFAASLGYQVPFAKGFLDETRGLPTLFREGIHV